MRTQDFLSLILPDAGFRAIGTLTPGAGMAHRWFQSFSEMTDYAQIKRAPNVAVYHACAAFVSPQRTAANALGAKSFWMDLDVGPGKPYAKIREAWEATQEFCNTLGFPLPLPIFSGNGLHVYWPFERPLSARLWAEYSSKLKALCATHRFHADPTRTADLASILRPVGSLNNKNGKEVRAVVEDCAISPSALLRAAIDAHYVGPDITIGARSVPVAPRASGVNAFLGAILPETPKYAEQVAAKCGQMAWIRDHQEIVHEPLWYKALSVLAHCVEPEQAAIAWSQRHPAYDEAETLRKLEQAGTASGPTTCERFRAENPEGCAGCTQSVRSPIVLGQLDAQAAVAVQAAAVEPAQGSYLGCPYPVLAPIPDPYRAFHDGSLGWADDDGVHRVADRLILVLGRERVRSDAGEFQYSVRVAVKDPSDSWLEKIVLMRDLVDVKTIASGFADMGIPNVDGGNMRQYLSAYIEALQSAQPSTEQVRNFGWQPPLDPSDPDSERPFVLGKFSYRKDKVVAVHPSQDVAHLISHLHPRGTLEAWRGAAERLATYHPFAYGVLLGFMAPLMRLARYDGATVVLIGIAGSGKTTTLQALLSIYGDPKHTLYSSHATTKAMMKNLRTLNSLPLAVDEIGTMRPWDLSELLMGVSSGTERQRLTSAARQMDTGERWATICVASANQTITSKLDATERDQNARRARLMEIFIGAENRFADGVMQQIGEDVCRNYGHAGPAWIEYVVENQEKLASAISEMTRTIHVELEITGDAAKQGQARFWVGLAAMARVAAVATKRLGLFALPDLEQFTDWLNAVILQSLDEAMMMSVTPNTVIAHYISSHADCQATLQVGTGAHSGQWTLIGQGVAPKAILIRTENYGIGPDAHTRRLILTESNFLEWCAKNQYDAGNIRRQLQARGAWTRLKRYGMMTGVINPVTAPIVPSACWSIDLIAAGIRMSPSPVEVVVDNTKSARKAADGQD